jgi:hypothetical protein
MFGLFTRAARQAAPATTRFVRPTLEALEARDCPSTITLSITGYAANKVVTAGGQVADTPNPGGLTVNLTLGGQAWCSTTTDANGNWSISATASSLGQITAATGDGQSNTASAMLTDSQRPVIDAFDCVSEGNQWVLFTGHVTDANYQGMVIQFNGIHTMDGQSTTVDSKGNFAFLAHLDGKADDIGVLNGQAVDWYGLASAFAETDVPPV